MHKKVSVEDKIDLLRGLEEFLLETDVNSIDFRSRRFDLERGYPQLKFCDSEDKDKCFVIMKDETSAKLLAREIAEEACDQGYDQDCPKEWIRRGEQTREEYINERMENNWCELVSGHFAGCNDTENRYVYWREL